jgi:hypothetical protein
MHLIDPLLDEGRTVYLDNRGPNARGTVCEKRIDLPKDIDKKALKRGEVEVWQLPLLAYVIRNDKHDVSLLSNCQSW